MKLIVPCKLELFCHKYILEKLNSILLAIESSCTLSCVWEIQEKIFRCFVSSWSWLERSVLSYRSSLASKLHWSLITNIPLPLLKIQLPSFFSIGYILPLSFVPLQPFGWCSEPYGTPTCSYRLAQGTGKSGICRRSLPLPRNFQALVYPFANCRSN